VRVFCDFLSEDFFMSENGKEPQFYEVGVDFDDKKIVLKAGVLEFKLSVEEAVSFLKALEQSINLLKNE